MSTAHFSTLDGQFDTPHGGRSADTWTTLSVTRVSRLRALYDCEGAHGGCISRPIPAVLLQQNAEGHRRSVFAVAVGAELVPVDRYAGFVSVIAKDVWEVNSCMNWLPALLEREKAQ
jgi:hypothetical protein